MKKRKRDGMTEFVSLAMDRRRHSCRHRKGRGLKKSKDGREGKGKERWSDIICFVGIQTQAKEKV